jgi:hypothetical protein
MTRWIGNIIMELRRVIVRIGKDGSGPGSYAWEVSDLPGTSSGVKSYIRINNTPMEYYVAWMINSNESCEGAHRLHIRVQKYNTART